MDATRDGGTARGTGDLDSTVLALAELMARRRNGRSIACAETFTGGLLVRSLSTVEPASGWFAGGIVVPDDHRGRRILGVRAPDAVSEGCAVQMSLGVQRLLSADAAVAVVGVDRGQRLGDPGPGIVVVGWVVDRTFGATTLELPGAGQELALRAVRTALTSLSRAMTDADDARS
jgi:nicotinamide-nucleotide amidase